MNIKVFQKTQRELAASINHVIDKYWDDEIDEVKMIELIELLFDKNKNKFLKDGNYTTILRQQCGKRRLEVVSKILNSLNMIK